MDHPLGGAIAQYISILMAEVLLCYMLLGFLSPLKIPHFLNQYEIYIEMSRYNQMYRSGIHQGFENSPQNCKIILILVNFNKQYSVKIVNIFINIIKYSNLIIKM